MLSFCLSKYQGFCFVCRNFNYLKSQRSLGFNKYCKKNNWKRFAVFIIIHFKGFNFLKVMEINEMSLDFRFRAKIIGIVNKKYLFSLFYRGTRMEQLVYSVSALDLFFVVVAVADLISFLKYCKTFIKTLLLCSYVLPFF